MNVKVTKHCYITTSITSKSKQLINFSENIWLAWEGDTQESQAVAVDQQLVKPYIQKLTLHGHQSPQF